MNPRFAQGKKRLVFPLYKEGQSTCSGPAQIADFRRISPAKATWRWPLTAAAPSQGARACCFSSPTFKAQHHDPDRTPMQDRGELKGRTASTPFFYVAGYPVKLLREGVDGGQIRLALIPITRQEHHEIYPPRRTGNTYPWAKTAY